MSIQTLFAILFLDPLAFFFSRGKMLTVTQNANATVKNIDKLNYIKNQTKISDITQHEEQTWGEA